MVYNSFHDDGGVPFPVYTGLLGKKPGTAWQWLVLLPDGGECNALEQTAAADDPDNPCYNWTAMDRWVGDGQAHGVPVIYDFNYPPSYAQADGGTHCTLLNPTAVTGFATAVAKRYGGTGVQQGCTAAAPACHGVIRYYEEGNEINDWSCSGGVGFEDTWANDATQAGWIYGAVKAVDPSAIVATPNMAGGSYDPPGVPTYTGTPDFTVWLDNYLDAGGALYADAVGYHAYGANNTPYQGSKVYVTSALGCDQATDAIGCAGQPLLNAYNLTRAVMAKYGLGDKPILNSEGSWGPDTDDGCAAPLSTTGCLSLADQTAYAARWAILLASTYSDGVGAVAQWYSYDMNWGTLNGSIAQSPTAATAWDQATSWVIGATFPSQCAKAAGTTVFVCDLTLAGGSQAQIVFNDGAGAVTSYAVPAWATQQTVLLGSPTAISGGLVSVGNAPVLLQP
ncbi:MAG: hypothetical protein ACYDCL_12450 [Myxococcales bacterium]